MELFNINIQYDRLINVFGKDWHSCTFVLNYCIILYIKCVCVFPDNIQLLVTSVSSQGLIASMRQPSQVPPFLCGDEGLTSCERSLLRASLPHRLVAVRLLVVGPHPHLVQTARGWRTHSRYRRQSSTANTAVLRETTGISTFGYFSK